jgi:hypothetical protein
MNTKRSEEILKILNKKRLIQKWILEDYKKKPLILFGDTGVGKTSLAKYILESFVLIEVNIDFCKKSQTLDDFLELSLYKKSITMMFDKKTRKKALLFDDLKYIQHSDKNLFKQIIDFSKKKCNFPVIYIFNSISHKMIQSVYKNSYPIHMSFNKKQWCNFVESYYPYPIKNISINNLIETSEYNFHNIEINIKLYGNDTSKINRVEKNYDDLLFLIQKIYREMDISTIYRGSISDYHTITLNLLENFMIWIYNSKYISYKKKIKKINEYYQSNIIADTIYFKTHKNNDWDNIEHIITNGVVVPLNIISSLKIKIKEMIYNKYISRSIIYTHNNKLLYASSLNVDILSCVYTLYISKNYDSLRKIIKYYSINQKIFEKFSKYYVKNIPKKIIKIIFKN